VAAAEPESTRRAVNRGELVRAIQIYQVARMRSTHEVLFGSPRYQPLCEFFLADLYGPREIGSSRAAAVHSLVDMLKPILPGWIHDGGLGLIELHSLSEQLDDRLARTLLSHGGSVGFSKAEFEPAYLACDDYEDRLRQIALSAASTRFGHRLARDPSIVRLVRLARGLRGLQRLESLLAMLERGFRAFRQADDIDTFVEAMRVGETSYVNHVYARRRS